MRAGASEAAGSGKQLCGKRSARLGSRVKVRAPGPAQGSFLPVWALLETIQEKAELN